MKRVLSSILISFIIFANLLAPFSVGWGKNGVEVKKNEAVADSSIIPLSVNSSSPLLRKTYVKINGIFSSTEKIDTKDLSVEYFISDNQNEVTTLTTVSGSQTGSAFQIYTKNENNVTTYDYWFGLQIEKYANNKGVFDFENDKTYYVYVKVGQSKDGVATKVGQSKVEQFVAGVPSETGDYYITDEGKAIFLEAKKEAIANGSTEEQAVIIAQKKVGNEKDGLYNDPDTMPACGLDGVSDKGTVMGCVAQGFYYVLFMPTSYLFALSGVFFDTTFAYSVQDTSYRSVFVVQGWGLVRDICNLFFIFVLLYVAIGTTLSLHSMKTKEVIINVVIIGLFINFSLFATQLIIDASNITAKVFYNSDAIVPQKDGPDSASNLVSKPNANGTISLSAGLVNKVNPQNIILHSKQLQNIPDKGQASNTDDNKDRNLSAGSFILIVLIASAVNIVGFIVFLVVGMLFVTRIVGLWIAMILAPLAFFTYILPEEMAGIKMIGWRNWWPDTLKLAFLAPVFMFFMYIILKFLSMDLISDIAGKSITQDGLGYFISILMPFAFIMVLLMKAKDIAKGMAGEMGEFATKMGSAVGGAALGLATGGAAMAMRGTLGRFGASVADSDKLKAREAAGGVGGFLAKMRLKAGEKLGGSSFDARNTKAGAAAGKSLGVDMGKAKEGGYTKMKADQIAASQKRAKELEKLSFNSPLNQKLREKQLQKKKLENELNPDIEIATADVATARTAAEDALKEYNRDTTNQAKKDAYDAALKKLADEKTNLTNLSNGGISQKRDHAGVLITQHNADGTIKYNTHNGSISEAEFKKAEDKEREDNTAATDATNKHNDLVTSEVADKNKVKDEAEKERLETEQKAKEEKEMAYSKAEEKILEAKKAESAALSAATTAEMAATMNPTDVNKAIAEEAGKRAKAASLDVDKAKNDAIITKQNADQKEIDTNNKAIQTKTEAIQKGEQMIDEAITKAATEKAEAIARQGESTTAAQQARDSINRLDSNGQAMGYGTSLKQAKIDEHHAHIEITKHENNIKEMYATSNQSKGTRVMGMIMTGGQYSQEGADEASHNIRMDVKTETAGGGGH